MTVTPPVDPATRPTNKWDMVTLKWLGRTLAGGVSGGELTITPDRAQSMFYDDPNAPVTVLPATITAPLTLVNIVDGTDLREYMYVAVNVPASDDPDITGVGFTYTASIKMKNSMVYGPFTFTVPWDTPGGVLWLNRVAAATATPGEALPQITKAEFDLAVWRITALEAGGGGGPSSRVAQTWVANDDGTWPSGVPATATELAPLVFYANLTGTRAGAKAFLRPPVQSKWAPYFGPKPIDAYPTVAASVASKNGRAVTYTATPTLNPDTTASYSWTFTGGGTASGLTVTNVHPATGAASGTVSMLDSDNLAATATASTTVTEGVPTVSVASAVDGQQITWTATAVDPEGEPVTYAWSGTDTLTGTAAVVAKTYATGGVKSATCVVTDSKGQTGTGTATASITSADAGGVYTADTFTTAAANAAAVLARTTEPGALGGSPTTPAVVTGGVSIASGEMTLKSDARVLYETGTTKPRVKCTIVAAPGTAIIDHRLCDDGGTNYLHVRFKTSTKGAYVARSTDLPSWVEWQAAPNGTWAEGDVVESTYDHATTTVTITVTRAGVPVSGSPFTYVKDSPIPSTSYTGVGSGSATSSGRIDDLVIGTVL